MAVRVVLADDHVMVRQGLRALLEREGFEVVGEASTGREALSSIERQKPDVAILDISMPHLNGIDTAREIRRAALPTKVVLLTMYTEERYVLESLRAGVSGYILKTKAANELVHGIREVCDGEIYLSSGVSRAVVEAYLSGRVDSEDPLTLREREVLQLIAEGKTTKEIAILLGVSTKTAETHRTHIMDKLEIHETAGLVRYAVRNGIVPS